MQSIIYSSMYALKDVPGKGKGLVAIEDIPRGTRILSEQPIITTPERKRNPQWLKKHISRQVESLSERERRLFFSMHNNYPYEEAVEQSLGILRTNSLPIDADGIDGGIFLEACRINHACDNNAQKHWNQSIKRHTVHALRDISKGEEITIYYLGLVNRRAIRRKKLQDKFGFLCACRLCSLPAEESRESDERLERIDQLDDLIGLDGMQLNFSLRTLRYVDERVRLCNEQGPYRPDLSRAYLDAAQVAIANGDLARGRIFAQRAVEGWQMTRGSDSEEVAEYGSLAQDPAKLPLYGLSMKWKTALDDIPEELDPLDFEDWLWRREKPRKHEPSEQLANLRDRSLFPSFAALPKSRHDSEWYAQIDDAHQPLRQWWFLGEIVDSRTLHHLELGLTDVDGKKIPLHFYTDGRGSEVATQIKTGLTVAVSCGQRYAFIYGGPGIRIEDLQTLKILPASLKQLLDCNDQLHKFSKEMDGVRKCHACSKQAPSLNKCGGCSMFWYCDTGCQRTGWNSKGHKATCKLLKNVEIRGLFGCAGA